MKFEMGEIYEWVKQCLNHNKRLLDLIDLKKTCLGE